MAVILAIALLVLSQATLSSQTSSVPYAPNSDGPGPTFSSKTVLHSFRGAYSFIHTVDFRNLKPLRNGRYRHDEESDHYSEELDNVYYLGDPKSGGQAALVLYSWFSVGGSSSQGGVAKVFRIIRGTLRSTQQIAWDTHFDAGQPFVSFTERNSTLTIRSAHYIPGDAHCCVSAMDVVTFHWDGTAFVQVGLQTELSEYGKKEGKHLPR